MIKVKIRTIWQGKVGIRDKYVLEALEKKEELLLVHENRQMTIPYDKIQERFAGRSEFKVGDRFGKEGHYLVYFVWNPEEDNQSSIFDFIKNEQKK